MTAAHVTLASSLGIGLYARTRYLYPERPFRMALAGPAPDPAVSWAYGTYRGHEVLFGPPGGSGYAWQPDAIDLFVYLVTPKKEVHTCLVRIAPSLLLGLHVQVDAERFIREALVPPAIPYMLGRSGDGGDVEDLADLVRRDGGSLEVSDTYVRLTGSARSGDTSYLSWALEAGVRVADRLVQRRAAMPPFPWEPPFAAALEATARARSMTFDRARMAAAGTAGDVSTHVELVTTTKPAPGYVIEVSARFQRLGAGLLVFAQAPLGLLHAVVRDYEVGDPAFDAAFIVQTHDKAQALKLLHPPELRQRLLAMAARAPFLQVEDHQVLLRLPAGITDPASLGYALDDVVAAAHLLLRAARGPAAGPSGPYR